MTLGTTNIALGTTASSLAALDSVGLGSQRRDDRNVDDGKSCIRWSDDHGSTEHVNNGGLDFCTAIEQRNERLCAANGWFREHFMDVCVGGTVTSVNMSVPSILSVSGGPVTSSGTLAVSLANENANLIFAIILGAGVPFVPFAGCRRHSVSAQRLAPKQFSDHRIHFGPAWWDCDFAGCSQ